MATLDDIISRLQLAKGDLLAQAVITADFALSVQPAATREALRAALGAAAVLRWFDVPLLAHLLEIADEEALARFDALAGLPFVEQFPSRSREARNVHDATRFGWRRRLWAEQPEIFRHLSARAAAFFRQGATPAERIEWIYHLLSADSDHAAAELEELDRAWASTAHPEDHQALALTIGELETSGLVSGKARLAVLLCCAEVRSSRGETARLGNEASEALELARSADHPRGLARAWCLSGDVLEAQGKLEQAQAAFGEYLAISQRLAEADASNAGWQLDLAVAHSRVGGILEAQGELEQAQAAFGEYLAISRRLAEADPSNAGWQRGLAVAHSRVGGILKARGKLEEAQAAFGEDLAISRRLAEADPSNLGWHRGLAVAHNRMGGVLEAQGKLEQAQAAFWEYLAISRRLAEADRSNAGWQRELAVAHSCAGDILKAQGKLEQAQAAFGESLAISRRLAEADPRNAGWQLDLAVAHSRVGGILEAQGKLEQAQAAFEEYLTISRRLAETDPSNAGWQRELAVALLRLSRMTVSPEEHDERLRRLREADRILASLILVAPDHPEWRREQQIVAREVADVELLVRSKE